MTVDELETCISDLLALVRSRGVTTIDLGRHDHYWTVTGPERLNMTDQPQQLGVGSLEDDQLELARLLVDPARASSVDLDRAAAMLHFLSDVLCG